MRDCGKCLHEEVCATAKACDGRVPRCKHFMDKDKCSTAQTVVQERKPLEAFLHPIIAYEGLKDKYLVFNAASGKKIENCFVLRPDRDTAAVDALRTYANSTDNKTLREDIHNWVGKDEPAQGWIPVPADELQKYIGVPVCILRKTDGQSWWAIIRGVKSDKVSTDYGGWFKLSEYGETWTVKYLPLSELPKEGTP